MTRINVRWVLGIMLMIIAITGFSCAHGNTEKKETAITPADQQEQYLKGIRESKKYVVARVNEADITLFNLINRMNQIAPDLLRTHERGPDMDEFLKREALGILIFRELAIQEAVRRGLEVPSDQIDEALEKRRVTMGSDEALKKFLKATGETEESLRKDIERNLLFDMIAEQEIYSVAMAGRHKDKSVEIRRTEWERELRQNAKIEITLDEVEKKLKEEAEKESKH